MQNEEGMLNRLHLMNNINALSKFGLEYYANVFLLKDEDRGKGKGKAIANDEDTGFVEVDFNDPKSNDTFLAQGINNDGSLNGKYYLAKFGRGDLNDDKINVWPREIRSLFKNSDTRNRIKLGWEHVEITGPYLENDPLLEDEDIKTFEVVGKAGVQENKNKNDKATGVQMQKCQSRFFQPKQAALSINSTAELSTSLSCNSSMF